MPCQAAFRLQLNVLRYIGQRCHYCQEQITELSVANDVPVSVANEMSGLKGRAEVMSHSHWRLRVDAVISVPSFGTGDEDTRSDYESDERKEDRRFKGPPS